MKLLAKLVMATLLGGSAIGLSASAASARTVCNDEGDCWHTHTDYVYPSGMSFDVHPDDWKWKEGEKHAWREHEGDDHGYWRKGMWVGF